jgi:hypothetical protein
MAATQAKSKRLLKPFWRYIAEGYRPNALEQIGERVIMEAKAVIVGTDISPSERKSLIEGFYEAISAMNDSGGKIVATAVVVE